MSSPADRDFNFGRYAQMVDRLRKDGAATSDDVAQFDQLVDGLMALDRPAEVAAIFDARFADVAAFQASSFQGDWGTARIIGSALDRVGRSDDARAMRRLARAEMDKAARARRRRPTPFPGPHCCSPKAIAPGR